MHRIALFWWEKETCVAHSEHFPQEKKVRLKYSWARLWHHDIYSLASVAYTHYIILAYLMLYIM